MEFKTTTIIILILIILVLILLSFLFLYKTKSKGLEEKIREGFIPMELHYYFENELQDHHSLQVIDKVVYCNKQPIFMIGFNSRAYRYVPNIKDFNIEIITGPELGRITKNLISIAQMDLAKDELVKKKRRVRTM